MIKIRNLNDEEWYCVTNDRGDVLIYTTSSSIAHFVNNFTPGLNPNYRINVGGDPDTRKRNNKIPVFHHARRRYR